MKTTTLLEVSKRPEESRLETPSNKTEDKGNHLQAVRGTRLLPLEAGMGKSRHSGSQQTDDYYRYDADVGAGIATVLSYSDAGRFHPQMSTLLETG